MHAMLFAAGLGTRLRPLTHELPKPVVPVANRPLAWFAMDRLARAGVTKIVANVHYLADRAEAQLQAWVPEGVELVVLREDDLLGTGGGLSNARAALFEGLGADEPVLVMNGDIVFNADLEAAIEAHRTRGAIATMVLREDADADRHGSIEIDGADRAGFVRRMLGHPEMSPEEAPELRKLMFTGVHVLSQEAFDDLPASGCIVRHSYRKWVDEGRPVVGVLDGNDWRDLGTLESYLHTNLAFASGVLKWPGITADERGIVDADCHAPTRPLSMSVTPTTALDGGVPHRITSAGTPAAIRRRSSVPAPGFAEVTDSVLGAGVKVDAGVRVSRSVVWPGVHVDRDADGVVLTGESVVSVL